MADAPPDFTPVTLITGLLGSGKTTLLQRLLLDPALSDTAVLINELGETAIPEAGCAIDDLGRQVTECLAQEVTDRAVEKIFENQTMPVVLGWLVPHSITVA